MAERCQKKDMIKTRVIQNAVEYAAFRSAIALFRTLPHRWSRAFVLSLFELVGYRIGVRRKLAEKQIAEVFPDWDKQKRNKVLRGVYRNMALNVISVYLTGDDELYKKSRFENKNLCAAALARNKGVLLITGHFGDWEAPCRVLPLEGYGLAMITKRQRNRKFDDYTNAIRERTGGAIIDMKHALRGVLEHTSHNDLIGILLDQDAGKRGVLVDFLGRPASNWKGTARIALKYRIPIVPAFVIRDRDETLRFRFEAMIDPEGLDDNEENMIILIKEMNRALEDKIRQYPEQWFWLHKRWKGARHFLRKEAEN